MGLPGRVGDPEQAEEPVNHARERDMLARRPGPGEAFGVGDALVAEHVALGGDDEGGRQPGVVGGEERGRTPVRGRLRPSKVVALKPAHRRRFEDVPVRVARVGGALATVVGHRVDEELVAKGGAAPIAGEEGDHRREVSAGGVAAHRDSFRVRAHVAAVLREPPDGSEAVVHRGREGVLGCHPVVHRDDDAPGFPAQAAADGVMGVEASDDMPASVEPGEDGVGGGPAHVVIAVDADRDRAGRTRNVAVHDRGDGRSREHLEARSHPGLELRAGRLRGEIMDGRQPGLGYLPEIGPDLRVNVGGNHPSAPGVVASGMAVGLPTAWYEIAACRAGGIQPGCGGADLALRPRGEQHVGPFRMEGEAGHMAGAGDAPAPAGEAGPTIKGLHHAAFRCRDSEETRRFYEDFLGLPLVDAFEIRQTKTGRSTSVLHTFFEMRDGSCMAFFEAPGRPFEFKDQHDFDLHIALEVEPAELEAKFAQGRERGIETRGIADHGFIHSIYFRDPNGYVVELSARKPDSASSGTAGDRPRTARDALDTWQRSKTGTARPEQDDR